MYLAKEPIVGDFVGGKLGLVTMLSMICLGKCIAVVGSLSGL